MTDVIRRKIDRARPALSEGAPGADRGWRLALARAARDAMGLDLDFRSLSITRRSLAEILELVPDLALIALLDGPQNGLGVIMLAPSVTSSLIEMQTLGRLSAQTPPARKASRIDAAMVAGFVDRALAGLDEALTDEADLTWAGGFRYASYLEDARPLGLMLEEDSYRVMSATLALGPLDREGQVIMILPAVGRGQCTDLALEPASAEVPQFAAALAEQILQSDCRLDAVIGRLRLPLHQIMDLAVGQALALPSAAVDAVALETIEGRRVAGARLGQNRGMRALRLTEAVTIAPQVPLDARSAQPLAASSSDFTPEFREAG
jgi:flagellar motor switch protein FliM